MSILTLSHIELAASKLAEAYSAAGKDDRETTIEHLNAARREISEALDAWQDYHRKKRP